MSPEQKQLSAAEKKEREDQLTCIDPNNSVVVTSCAGSGKTWLLTSRIIRIILENADRLEIDDGGEKAENGKGGGSFQLSSILAITFTKNATAEIEDRVRKRLQKMTRASEEELKNFLAEIGLTDPKYDKAFVSNAYRKFLLARPQLSVFTFHSWFNHLINYLPWGERPNLNSRVTDSAKHLQAVAWQETLTSIRDDAGSTREEKAAIKSEAHRFVAEYIAGLQDEARKEAEAARGRLVEEKTNHLIKELKEAAEAMRLLLKYHSLGTLKEKLLDPIIADRIGWLLYLGHSPEEPEAYEKFVSALGKDMPLPEQSCTKEDLLENQDFAGHLNTLIEFCSIEEPLENAMERDPGKEGLELLLALKTALEEGRKNLNSSEANSCKNLNRVLSALEQLVEKKGKKEKLVLKNRGKKRMASFQDELKRAVQENSTRNLFEAAISPNSSSTVAPNSSLDVALPKLKQIIANSLTDEVAEDEIPPPHIWTKQGKIISRIACFRSRLQEAADIKSEGDAEKYFQTVHKAIYTDKGELRADPNKAFCDYPPFMAVMGALEETERYEALLRTRDYNRACARIGMLYARNYARVKEREGVIDYADMEIVPVRALFKDTKGNALREASSAAMKDMFRRLDTKYRHVLVDEFQDTNPAQWLMLKAWLDHSDKDNLSVFIVGDPKQSIYSWRGSNPKLLDAANKYLQDHYDGRKIGVHQTRRCPQAVIELVNTLFTPSKGTAIDLVKEAFSCHDASANNKAESRDALQVLVDLAGEIFEDGFLKLEDFEPHGTKNSKAPGSVTLIKEEREESKEKENKKSSDDEGASPDEQQDSKEKENAKGSNESAAPPLRNPLVGPAQEDDESVEHAIREGEALGAVIEEFKKTGGYEESDIMLLHPAKTHSQGLTDGLASAGLSCGLIDRAARMDSLECQDILALLHAIFDPSYGLMVAQVLRSPIFNVPEEDLWKVFQAGDRKTHCDWVEGLDEAKGGKELTEAQSKLSSWREAYQKQKLPAHELLAMCYKEAHIINNYVAKVPPAMAKRVVLNLEWVLNYSLEALGGKLALPSEYAEHLQKLREASEDISSSMEQEKAIRSLTVHGAKGMEGRLVTIGNSNYPKRHGGTQMLLSWDVDALDKGPAHISFLRKKEEATENQKLALKQLEAEAAQERCNLLYVAMTRAKEHLIFSVKPMKEKANSPKEGWGNKVNDAGLLQKDAGVYRHGDHKAKRVVEEADDDDEQLVCWGEEPGKPGIDTEKKDALSEESIRGTQLHNLLALELQSSTDENGVLQLDLLAKRLDPADEKTWSMQRRLLGIGKKLQEKLAGQIKTILTNEKENPNYFGFLLAQEPFIECEVPAVNNDGESRRIDCLLTTKEGVIWILDFKTGNTEEHEDDHNKQLRGYREIVKKNYSDKDDDDIKIAIVDKEGELRKVPPE